jgi:hypothetical protein
MIAYLLGVAYGARQYYLRYYWLPRLRLVNAVRMMIWGICGPIIVVEDCIKNCFPYTTGIKPIV